MKLDGKIILIIIVILIALGVTQHAASGGFKSTKTPEVTTTEATKDSETEPASEPKSAGTPIVVGESAKVGDLSIKLNKVTPEGDSGIRADITLSEGGKFKNVNYSSKSAPIEYHDYKVSITGADAKKRTVIFKVEEPTQ